MARRLAWRLESRHRAKQSASGRMVKSLVQPEPGTRKALRAHPFPDKCVKGAPAVLDRRLSFAYGGRLAQPRGTKAAGAVNNFDDLGADLVLHHHHFGAGEQRSVDVNLDRFAGVTVQANVAPDIDFV